MLITIGYSYNYQKFSWLCSEHLSRQIIGRRKGWGIPKCLEPISNARLYNEWNGLSKMAADMQKRCVSSSLDRNNKLATAPMDLPQRMKFVCQALLQRQSRTTRMSSASWMPKVTVSPSEFPQPLKSNKHRLMLAFSIGSIR